MHPDYTLKTEDIQVEPPRDNTPVRTPLERVDAHIGWLNDAINGLEERLEPVLGAIPPTAVNDKPGEGSNGTSKMVYHLEMLLERLGNNTLHIRSITDRVEVWQIVRG